LSIQFLHYAEGSHINILIEEIRGTVNDRDGWALARPFPAGGHSSAIIEKRALSFPDVLSLV